ncbi:aromatic ring-hydroxylating dioxygenase subunit alpha [Oleomonas cavernae]|uniref:Aromatic ring-hydroxylating dioxygenase subunit alpha n=1 Tax=Oleomonas cavernae TaxID=2320859 RepID=A0A418WTX9_9PROT|nr:aromatic ring-hydroxylating dioxygenase subunit alpha [Oleomonas cavernae]RJF94720.1 aromatic ring-hydroxylating dioxygenase subunit alpha [Oleomonas cavernae]
MAALDAIRQDVIATAARPLDQAITLPPAAYTDEAHFALEREAVLKSGWLCLAHVSQLKTAGSYLALDLFDEPLLVVRDKAGEIRVLSRVCAHRAMDIMPDAPASGKVGLLVCPYHRWVYNLDGSLRGCSQMQHAASFDKRDWPLASFRSEVWHGFVFVNFDGQAEPLEQQYADFARAIAPWQVAEMEIAIDMAWDCPFNWKVMIENWMESYHHIGAHSKTLNLSMPGEATWSEPEHPHFIQAHLPYTDKLRGELAAAAAGGDKVPGFAPVPGLSDEQAHEWGLFVGHPCFMFLTTHDRVLWYRLLPVAADRCTLLTTTLVSKAAMAAADFEASLTSETEMLRAFHCEDMVVNAGVQRGLKSAKAVRGRLSHLEEPVWLIQRHLAARLQGRHPARASRAPYFGPRAAKAAE